MEQTERIAGVFGDRARLVTTRRFGHRRILGSPAVVDEIVRFVTGEQSTAAGRQDEVTTR
ncbi:hypothetical protein GCM10020295_70700 [Streptomyces cinereospinus]